MKTWDLRPGETVTLRGDGFHLPAKFLFRDTIHACFEVADGVFLDFHMTMDGDEVFVPPFGRRWTIEPHRSVDTSSRQVSIESFFGGVGYERHG